MEQETHTENEHIKNKFKLGVWQVSTLVFGVISLILIIMIFTGKTTGSVISGDEAGKDIVQFLNKQTNGGVEFVSSNDRGYLYEINVKYQGQEIPVYTTKDGKYFVQNAVSLTDQPVMGNNVANSNINAPKGVIKSDKPIVETFVFSYCPYGLQFEKALFPAYDLLKDKADFRIVAIGAMHGEFEKTESLRQISIENIYGKDKLFSYLKEFDINGDIGSCSGDESCLNNYLPDVYKKLSIDKTKIENYMKSDATKIYNEQNARANSLGVGGSPTFIINGAQVQVSRTAESIKEAVCNAFNTKPEECSQSLSTQSANPGFG